jgi:peptidoglycan-N-acetylglucosamine deacetylase
MYFLPHTPGLIRTLTPGLTWRIPVTGTSVFLTFDDGPTPGVTEKVLDILDRFQAKATFFCVGKNVEKHPSLYDEIIRRGHKTGNHSHSHPNGWNTNTQMYVDDVFLCSQSVPTSLFRPPYGKLSISQYYALKAHFNIVMWDLLTYDFDERISISRSVKVIEQKCKPGSIIVFHDSLKASQKMFAMLPIVLQLLSNKGYTFQPIFNHQEL